MLLAGAILIVIRGFLLRPLAVVTERLRAANGVEGPEVDTDKYCAEIRDLAELSDQIKSGRAE